MEGTEINDVQSDGTSIQNALYDPSRTAEVQSESVSHVMPINNYSDNSIILHDSETITVQSKNERKRLLKIQRWEFQKRLKKETQKEKKRIKQQLNHELIEIQHNEVVDQVQSSSSLTSSTPSSSSSSNHEQIQLVTEPGDEKDKKNIVQTASVASMIKQQLKKQNFINRCNDNFSIIIDCAFDDCHSEKDLKSLGQQIGYCYGANHRHQKPCHVYLTSMGTKLTNQLKKSKCESWTAVNLSTLCYTQMDQFCIKSNDTENIGIDTSSSSSGQNQEYAASSVGSSGNTDTNIETNTHHRSDATPYNQTEHTPLLSLTQFNKQPKQLVYLTSDAEEILESLDPNCAYIIGGIVDRNRLKGMTYEKAKSQGIRTAKLPIKEYFKLSATHILTINHVFEVLLTFNVLKDWKLTLEHVLPARKEIKSLDEEAVIPLASTATIVSEP